MNNISQCSISGRSRAAICDKAQSFLYIKLLNLEQVREVKLRINKNPEININ